eukprot:15328032-Ditylum_brightwellii.AAC.1
MRPNVTHSTGIATDLRGTSRCLIHNTTSKSKVLDQLCIGNIQVLYMYKNSVPWYYGVKLEASNPHSFGSALGLKDSSKVNISKWKGEKKTELVELFGAEAVLNQSSVHV